MGLYGRVCCDCYEHAKEAPKKTKEKLKRESPSQLTIVVPFFFFLYSPKSLEQGQSPIVRSQVVLRGTLGGYKRQILAFCAFAPFGYL